MRHPPEHAEQRVYRSWWHDALCYQVYIRSFADSDGDGVGDLEGVRSRLGYLELLGVDALGLTPFYPSPMADHGYDVANPRDVDRLFGDLDAFDRLVTEATAHGIRVTIDLVPNHTSAAHPWFQSALLSGRGSAARERYLFRDGGGDGSVPPNNWVSAFGGPAWTRTQDGQWYLHLFAPEQPDLNWAHPDVPGDLIRTLRFWLDRGVSGFRVDVANGLAELAGEPDPGRDHDGVHEIHRMIRKVLDEYPGSLALGQIQVAGDERYLRPDELHLADNVQLVAAEFDADAVRRAIEESLSAVAGTGAQPTWTLANHDVVRQVSRYGGGAAGTRRARAMALVELGLPGVVHLYNGEELGLPDVDLPEAALRDPRWKRSGHRLPARDGCRVPLPWEGTEPPFGFTDGTRTWLPMPPEWMVLTVEQQLEDPDSTLSLYRHAIELRRRHPAFAGSTLDWFGAPAGCFAYRRRGGGLSCALNTTSAPVPLPPGELLLASGPLADRMLPPDTAAWLV
ncbi:MAG TPA: glycoside hydrolase family 13 protein [Actinophytocola sp.]|uniref:glycoside hydrolase family 13 protein n=1 Tax=Actinophytocola sp. TaxID=1872138 RepID=UPI002DB774CE|nr:glycoside hydrolase family 13 protein [Actinophytocola sp.]HEU5471174.1 glycoside hydrolase family 13 protein [Actinophytocola sp.]